MEMIEEQKRAAEEQASKEILRSIHRAFREALLALPKEEYDWFQVADGKHESRQSRKSPGLPLSDQPPNDEIEGGASEHKPQREFFNFPGPLYKSAISPASCTIRVGESRNFRAVARDRNGRLVDENLTLRGLFLTVPVSFQVRIRRLWFSDASNEPGLTQMSVTVRQGEIECEAEALITVTEELLPEATRGSGVRQGLPSYTFNHRPGELWRSRFRPGSQSNHHQQCAPRFRLFLAQPHIEASLYLPPLYQGVGAEQLSRSLCRPSAGTYGRAFHLYRRASQVGLF